MKRPQHTHKSICFVTSVFANKSNVIDQPPVFAINAKYDYVLFTNLDASIFDTSWNIITIPNAELPSTNPIINSRYPKFMGSHLLAKYKSQHTYDIIVYCDGYLTPLLGASWESVVRMVQQASFGIVQTLHRRTVYEECEAIIASRKDTVQSVNKLRQYMLKSQTPIDTPMYENTAFAYDPRNTQLQQAFTTFWNDYRTGKLSYRDQPLWASILHRQQIRPHIIGSRETDDHLHSARWFRRSAVGFNGHTYVDTHSLPVIRVFFLVASKQPGSSKLRAQQIADVLSKTYQLSVSVLTHTEATIEHRQHDLIDSDSHTHVFIWLKSVPTALYSSIQQSHTRRAPAVHIFDPVDSYALNKSLVLKTCNRHRFDVILTNNEAMTNDMLMCVRDGTATRFVVVHHHWDPGLNVVRKQLVEQAQLRFGYMGSVRSLAHSNNAGDYAFLTMLDEFPICFVDTESGTNVTDVLRKQPDVTKLPPLPKGTRDTFDKLVLPFNCHLSIREPRTDLFRFKTTAKVVTAAALGHVIVTTREPSAVELLGPDYPFYFEGVGNDSIRRTLRTVRADFDGTKENWTKAMQLLDRVKRSKTLENVCRLHYVTLLSSLAKHPHPAQAATPSSSVLVILSFATPTNDQHLRQAHAHHCRFFQQLRTEHRHLHVDLCLLTLTGASLKSVQELYISNPPHNIRTVSILLCQPEMEMHELADQVLYRLQKQRSGYYDYVCLLQANVWFTDAFYKALTLPTDKMLFPFVHRDSRHIPSRTRKANPMVSTAFVSIPASIVAELSHLPLTANALDYAPYPHAFLLEGDDNARHADAMVESNSVYGVIGT